MDFVDGIIILTQIIFCSVATYYFYTNIKTQQNSKTFIEADSKREMEKLKKLRSIHLNKPLSEITRPKLFTEIIGQDKGVKGLKAALYGSTPQHTIIYGPPGIGKTAAARLALENASHSAGSPFCGDSPFVEVDATIMQYDERSIADPLIGSVHDPIYQGAGSYGSAGVPQPKPGAVTKAHGGVLFVDEIGELSQNQMNRLLKVLEDRKVTLSSSYYSKENNNIPKHIHDIFQHGLPADFRLIGATTRSPDEIPPALRSRCREIFFRSLNQEEIRIIALNALNSVGMEVEGNVPNIIASYSQNGRDTVNIVETARSIAMLDNRTHIRTEDVEEVIEQGRYCPVLLKKVENGKKVGVVNGLAVGGSSGMLLEIEASILPNKNKGRGQLKITGIVEKEEINGKFSKLIIVGSAKASVENAITLINHMTDIKAENYNIHLNFPGGMPIDGPSAGSAIFLALYSAFHNVSISQSTAITGEISIKGKVCAVGGVASKIEAAVAAGADKVIIPVDNYRKAYENYNIKVVAVDNVKSLIKETFNEEDTPRISEKGQIIIDIVPTRAASVEWVEKNEDF